MNFPAILVAAFVPILVGFLWYNILFSNLWMQSSGLSEEKLQKGSMPLIFGISLVLSFLLSAMMTQIVIHQSHMFSLLVTLPGFEDPNSEWAIYYADFKDKFGDMFRTFGHGSFHGAFAGVFLALPILGINALFERKGFKYIAINCGYWIVTMALMGGILSAWK